MRLLACAGVKDGEGRGSSWRELDGRRGIVEGHWDGMEGDMKRKGGRYRPVQGRYHWLGSAMRR